MENMDMTGSVFSTIWMYFKDLFLSIKSLFHSSFTALSYVFNVGELRKEVTEQYPDPVSSKTADDLPARTRGLLFNDIDKCTGCGDCEWICPAKCITLEKEPGSDLSKVWVSVFDIDLAKCVFCGLCVEVCQPESLIHTKQFEGAVYQPEDLIVSFGRGHVTPEQRTRWMTIRHSKETEGGVSL